MHPEIEVMRIGHRPQRDKRITTHICLVARAMDASAIYIDRKDSKLEETVNSVTKRFGGDIHVESGCSWRKKIRDFNGVVVHLTMYGEPLDWVLPEIKDKERIMVVVGAEKVPAEMYSLADYNVAIGNEPHSEVAALGLFLGKIKGDVWPNVVHNGSMIILPSRKGKIVIHKDYMKAKGLTYQEDDIPGLFESIELQDNIATHSKAVHDLALKIVDQMTEGGVKINRKVVAIGALLHDIGRRRTHSIYHAVAGARIIHLLGYPEEVALIAQKHIGGGISAEEAAKLGLPELDYIPSTLEEKIVCQADNLVSEDKKISLREVQEKYKKRHLDHQVKRISDLHKELSHLAGIDLDDITL